MNEIQAIKKNHNRRIIHELRKTIKEINKKQLSIRKLRKEIDRLDNDTQ